MKCNRIFAFTLMALALFGIRNTARAQSQTVYYQGGDNNLWQITPGNPNPTEVNAYIVVTNPDGSTTTASQTTKLGIVPTNQDSVSGDILRPVVFSGLVYYIGPDPNVTKYFNYPSSQASHSLWRYDPNSNTATHIAYVQPNSTDKGNGGAFASSPPCVTLQYLYFQGTDNKLYKDDLNGNVLWGGQIPIYSPPVVYGGKIYFQGANNQLMSTDTDGNNVGWVGAQYTLSKPFVYYYPGVPNKYPAYAALYFRNNHNSLITTPPNNFNSFQQLGPNLGLVDTPIVLNQNVDSNGNANGPSNPIVYYMGTDSGVYEYNQGTNTQNKLAGSQFTFSGPALALGQIWVGQPFGQGVASYPVGWNAKGTWSKYNNANYAGPRTGVSQQDGLYFNGVYQQLKYQIYSVRYAPPGTSVNLNSNNAAPPSVTYSSSSSSSVTNKVVNTFGNTDTVGFNAGVSDELNSFSLSSAFSYSYENSTESSQTATSGTVLSDTLVYGNSRDGINHDYDEIWLIMNPEIDTMVSLADSSSAWFFTTPRANPNDYSRVAPIYQHATVGTFKKGLNTTTRVNGKIVTIPGVQPLPAPYNNLTQAEIKQILQQDPFADAPGVQPVVTIPATGPPSSALIDQNRYTYLTNFPYDRETDNGIHNISGASFTWDDSHYTGTEASNTYSVTVSRTGGIGVEALGDYASITSSNSFSYTNTTSHSTENSTGYALSYTIYNPSAHWPSTAPSTVYVYIDKLYNTLLFSFIAPQ